MSALLSGLLGVAINIAPQLFKVLSADREEGSFREEAIEIVKGLVKTDDAVAAVEKVAKDPLLQAKLREELAALEVRALEEQNRAEAEQKRIDQAFLELETAEREQVRQQQIEQLKVELESVEAARDYALEISKSERVWISGINPLLSLLITAGFVTALALIMTKPVIANVEIFYTAIGALATGFATIIGFHFGSSSGSKLKDDMIIDIPERTDPAGGAASPTGATVPGSVPPEAGDIVVPSAAEPSEPPPDPGGTFGLFRQKAPDIMADLMSDFGMTLNQAAGVLGNVGHECAGFRTMQEIKPIVPGSRGGWGWAQWTGPRRRAFEQWCLDNGFDNLSADAANYGFLKHELETTERRALNHLRGTDSLRDATTSFMEKFERPGVKHLSSRINWAKEAVKAYRRRSN